MERTLWKKSIINWIKKKIWNWAMNLEKLVFLNHINKQTKIPKKKNSKKKSINPLKMIETKDKLRASSKNLLKQSRRKSWKKFTKNLKHSKKSLKNPGKNDVIKCK